MEKLNQWEENKIIKKLILQKLQENQSGQWFYCVLHYSNWGDDGNLLEWDRRKWFYNENYIRENHRRIRRTLREHLGRNIFQYFTLERHQGRYEKVKVGPHIQNGDFLKGKYHTNLLIGPIPDQKIENPKTKLKKLFHTSSSGGKPISQTKYKSSSELKIDLLNSIIRLHPDISKYGPSVHTQSVKGKYGNQNVGHYSMKDIFKKGLDFTEVLDWNNSDITTEVK